MYTIPFEKMGQNRNWTLEEKKYLENSWGNVSIETIMKKLNRSRNAINVMVQKLGLGAFLENGDYVTWNQLLKAIGCGNGSGYKTTSWVKNRGFPLHMQKVGTNSFKVVRIDEFWGWAEKNKDFLDFSKFEENILGIEPDWAKEKRRQDIEDSHKYIKTPWTAAEDAKLIRLLGQQKYNYDDLSRLIRRTNGAIQRRICDLGLKDRPVKANNHIKWTKEDLQTLGELVKAGCSYESISEKLGKSSKAIRGKVYFTYLTENLDKARERIGSGSWGDNRPKRKIKQWNVMDTQERAETRDLLIRLTAVLNHKFKENLNQTEWGAFFQKDMCQNFSGKCLQTSGCDECENYKKLEPQVCRMCGRTYYERKTNNFCQACRNMRKKQYLRKRMALTK